MLALAQTDPALLTFSSDVSDAEAVAAFYQAVDAWLQTIDININGMFLMTMHAIPLLRMERPGSSIITTSSNAGLTGCPLRGPYTASKWALIGLTKTLAMGLGPESIRANALCPASVEGPRIDRVIAADAAERRSDD